MANTSEFIPSRSEAGEEIEPQRSILGVPNKTYIVGRYSIDGRAITNGAPVDSPRAVSKHQQLLIESMSGRGRLMPGFIMTPNGPVKQSLVGPPPPTLPTAKLPKQTVKANKARAKAIEKAAAKVEANYVQIGEPEPPVPYTMTVATSATTNTYKEDKKGFTVVFAIESGKIKSTCDAVLENDLALMLVYSDEDSISYLPEKGSELLIITPDKREVAVMYLGLNFEWYESRQQLLVFMKTDVE